MRSASTYRAAKKRMAKEAGVKFADFNERYHRSRHFAAAELERKALLLSPGAATRVLGEWAKNGGRPTAASPAVTAAELDAMNTAGGLKQISAAETEAATAAAKKLTVADIDTAMERALSVHQATGNAAPLVLNAMFAARARALGWVENVEFVEDAHG